MVDGQENPLQQIYLSRLYEAQPYCALTGHIYNSAYVLMSERFFQSLDDADRALFRDCVRDSARWQLDYMASLDAELEKKLRDAGMELTEPDRDAFRAATLPAHAALVERLGGRGAQVLERIKRVEQRRHEPRRGLTAPFGANTLGARRPTLQGGSGDARRRRQ